MKIVFVTVPAEAAAFLAFGLVEERLAACVNILPGVSSIYRWHGVVEHSSEALLVAKTSDDALPALMKFVAQEHPHECPEIVAIDVVDAHAPYAKWVDDETRPKVSGARVDEAGERSTSPRGLSGLRKEGTMKKKKGGKKAARKSLAKKTKKKK